MEDNLALCASAFVRNKGKNAFTENDILMGLSMDLRWMTYSEAKAFLNAMMTAGLFERSGDIYRPLFSPKDIDVPVAYRPSRDLVENIISSKPSQEPTKAQEQQNVPDTNVPEDMMPLLMKVAEDNGIPRKDFMMQSNTIKKKLGVFIEVAALFVLRDSGVDITELADRVYDSVKLK